VRRDGCYRNLCRFGARADRPPFAVWRNNGIAREVVVWCSNDYLGMGRHPAVINAMIETAAGATTGYRKSSRPFFGTFTSGYVSNEAALGTIGRLLPNCLIPTPARSRNVD
jgi:5-aminolevulinate synthase